MDTIVFVSILTIGGWLMYALGHYHGYQVGEQDAVDKISKRHPFRSIIYDAYDK